MADDKDLKLQRQIYQMHKEGYEKIAEAFSKKNHDLVNIVLFVLVLHRMKSINNWNNYKINSIIYI